MDREFIEVSFVIPCLNESRTIKQVIKSCHKVGNCFESYEIIIADNMSEDNSDVIALEAKAKVVKVKSPGYGSALKAGIKAARGEYIVMGDADNTYDFTDSLAMIKQIKTYSCDLVIGDRFKGKIEEGAMPKLHRYFGNPVLSTIGKLLYSANINDFHCGIRLFKRKSIIALDLKSNGMEYASEMIIRSLLANYKINQVPVSLRRSIPDRIPHLHSWRDGWRHLKLLLTFSPKFTYFPISLFFLTLSLILFILYLRNQDPFAGTNTLMFIIVFYNFALSSFSEYITCRLLISNNIKYKTNFLSEFLFKSISKYENLDKAYQIILALLISFSIQVVLLLYKMSQISNFLQTKTGNLYSFNLMLITSTVLFLYLSSSKLGTIFWLNRKDI